ncbi:predicted signal protein [gamma proteobacterium HdN1]|nr:predicted signal protein [gamma proteobacterium HdN1]
MQFYSTKGSLFIIQVAQPSMRGNAAASQCHDPAQMTLSQPASQHLAAALQNALFTLYQTQALWDMPLNNSLQTIAQAVCEVLNADFVSLWRCPLDLQSLDCQVFISSEKQTFDLPAHLCREQFPHYFQTITQCRALNVADVLKDTRVSELVKPWFIPTGVRSLLDVTLRESGQLCGILRIEQRNATRTWNADEITFANSVADLISQISMFHRLRESDERNRTLLDLSRDAIVTWQDGRHIDCNHTAEVLFGASRAEILNSTPSELSAAVQLDGQASEPAANSHIEAALRGEPQFFPWLHRRKDGRNFEAEVSIRRTETSTGFCLHAIIRDVTARNRLDRAIRMIAQMVSVRGDSTFFEQMVSHLTHNFDVCCALIAKIDPQTPTQATTVAVCINDTIAANFEHTLIGSAFEYLLQNNGCLVEKDLQKRFPSDPLLHNINAQSMLGIPFHNSSGKVAGFIAILNHLPMDACDQHFEILEIFAARTGSELERLAVQEKLQFAADNDPLTRLPNRRKLHEVVRNAITRWQPGSERGPILMLLDLNRFKDVNDTLGHHIGDQLLIEVGLRLQSVLENYHALLSRLGGDEFAILAEQIKGLEDAHKLADEISAVLNQPFHVGEIMLSLSASLGIAFYPQHGRDSHALLRGADVAMYHAKQNHVGFAVYHPSQDAHTPRRLRLMTDLRRAIRERQIVLHFQPKLDVESGQCIGCEALARWFHPDLGLIPPAEFIPLAEMNEVIHELSLYVTETALDQITEWDKRGLHLSVAVNLSARDLLNLSFTERLCELIEIRGISSERLEIEITESALIHDPERVLDTLHRLSQHGVRFSIDDFGTGYSSLAYLKRLPINALKIDASFVQDMMTNEQDEIIVKSIISLAHNLGMQVVAEGAENRAVVERLTQLRCDMVQGFYISSALPTEQLESWLRCQPWAGTPCLGG